MQEQIDKELFVDENECHTDMLACSFGRYCRKTAVGKCDICGDPLCQEHMTVLHSAPGDKELPKHQFKEGLTIIVCRECLKSAPRYGKRNLIYLDSQYYGG